jgi:hypothetical protein
MKFIEEFEGFLTEETWNDRFDMKLETYLD